MTFRLQRLALSVACAIACAAPAAATTIDPTTVETFHFSGYSKPSATKTFTSDNGSDLVVSALQIQKKKVWTKTGWSWSYDYEKVVDQAFVTQPGWGVGVADYDDWNMLIDDEGPADFIVLTLPDDTWQPVSLKLVGFDDDDHDRYGHKHKSGYKKSHHSYWHKDHDDYLDVDEFVIYGANTLDTSSYGALMGSLTMLTESEDDNPNPFFFGDDVGTFKHIIVSATGFDYEDDDDAKYSKSKYKHKKYKHKKHKYYDDDDFDYEGFLVKKFQGTVVPVPPALPLMATGLVALALLRRRRAKLG